MFSQLFVNAINSAIGIDYFTDDRVANIIRLGLVSIPSVLFGIGWIWTGRVLWLEGSKS
jgi:hypothetical protein